MSNTVLVGTRIPKVLNYLKRLEKSGEIRLLQLPEESINQVCGSESYDARNLPESIQGFVSDESNRTIAIEKAKSLCAILCNHYDVKSDELVTTVWTTTQIVKATNLSHSKTKSLIFLLKTFGLIHVMSVTEFRFEFDNELSALILFSDVERDLAIMLNSVAKYESYVKANNIESKINKEVIEQLKKLA